MPSKQPSATPLPLSRHHRRQTPIEPADIAEALRYSISYHGTEWTSGETGTELNLYAVLRLKDGRWASLEAWNDYTGWGCQDGATVRIGATREAVTRFGLTDAGRRALGMAGDPK